MSIWLTGAPFSTTGHLSTLVPSAVPVPNASCSEVPACFAAGPGQVMTHSHFPEKGNIASIYIYSSNIASGDLIIYGASVYLESLQRKMAKEQEL